MMKCFKVLGVLCLFIYMSLPAHAGIFSKIGNWFNTDWNDYEYNDGYQNHKHSHRFYNNGAFTGVTPPPFNDNNYYPNSRYFCPNSVNRFNHLPNGSIPQLNIPTQAITDFSTNVGSGAKIHILD